MSYPVNPIHIIQQIKNGANPQQLMLSILEDGATSTPFGDNLIYLIKNNKTAEIEKIARNLAKSQGRDFDKEFTAFRKNLGL